MKGHRRIDRNVIEILAPAGSYNSLKAAICAGADAVYIGGSRFGARAFADNLDQEAMLEAIDFVHLHGRKIYLTVNTLLKERELEEELFAYLKPFYEQGLDAVIVQDIGVLSYIRRRFPGLPVHASTQMTITDTPGVQFLEQQGVSRVVLARELSIDEVADITRHTAAEIECFVHGALCYCYSGQCLYSSLIGGRSGNRGQCAQPCRLPYQVGTERPRSYLLSLKDICTLEYIPDLLDAGITSFKIEGRMKKPEYVAVVTSMYRKYVDMYFRVGRSGFKVAQDDMDMMLDVYNRGGFHSGYLHQHNGKEMLADKRPNHAGIPAVKMEKNRKARILRNMHAGDVIELPGGKMNYTFGKDAVKGEDFSIPALQNRTVKSGMILNRVRNEQLLRTLRETYLDKEFKEKINGNLILSAGKSAKLILCFGEDCAEVTGTVVEASVNQPMDEQRIRRQMLKTGGTPFEFEELDIFIEGNIFFPIQELNQLRRQGLKQLEQAVVKKYRRTGVESLEKAENLKAAAITDGGALRLHVSVETPEQFQAVCSCEAVWRIYIEDSAPEYPYQEQAHQAGKEVFLAMPYIFRRTARARYEAAGDGPGADWDGVLVRNYESISYLRSLKYDGQIVTDHNLYIFNREAKSFWQKAGAGLMTAPLELNYQELKELGMTGCELVAYGYLPMMVTAGCIRRNTQKCHKLSGSLIIKDRYQKQFRVKNDCRNCYNMIYNTLPLVLNDQMRAIRQLAPAALRLMFTSESGKHTEAVLDAYCRSAAGEKVEPPVAEFTRGHFKRGIK